MTTHGVVGSVKLVLRTSTIVLILSLKKGETRFVMISAGEHLEDSATALVSGTCAHSRPLLLIHLGYYLIRHCHLIVLIAPKTCICE